MPHSVISCAYPFPLINEARPRAGVYVWRKEKKKVKIALCGLRWFKLNVSKCQKMSSCQKDAKCQIVKHLDYGGGSEKK